MLNKIINISNSPNLKSIRFNLPFWNYELVKVRTPKEEVCGLTSKTIDNKHILVLDYDLVDRSVVLGDLIMLRGLIKPSVVLLFTTYEKQDELGVIGNYHLIFLDKFFYREAENIMAITHADSIHRQLANKSRYHSWVIRITEKGNRDPPKLIKVWNFKGKRENSYAHYLLLKNLYNFKLDVKKVNFDKFTNTLITKYNTASKLDIKDIV